MAKKPMKIYEETKIGGLIRKYMSLRGVSLHGLAKEIGVSAEAVRKLANGMSLSTYFVKEICEALNIPHQEVEALNLPAPDAGGQPKHMRDEVYFFRIGKKPRTRAAKSENFMDLFSGHDSAGRTVLGVKVIEGLNFDSDSYAVQVHDNKMAPDVKAGDIMIAFIQRNPIKNNLVIVEYEHDDRLVAVVRRYIGVEEGDLRLFQTNPMQEERIAEHKVVRVVYAEIAKMVG